MNGATMLWRAAFDADAGENARHRAEPWPSPFAGLATAALRLLRRALVAAQRPADCCAEGVR